VLRSVGALQQAAAPVTLRVLGRLHTACTAVQCTWQEAAAVSLV
jgi:hypothetical protein